MLMKNENFIRILKAIARDITPRQVMEGHKVITAVERFTL